jgi:hypothetical protein
MSCQEVSQEANRFRFTFNPWSELSPTLFIVACGCPPNTTHKYLSAIRAKPGLPRPLMWDDTKPFALW